jgi:Zn-finger nucleic acid-binding protein
MAPTLRLCLYCGSAPVETRPRERHIECPACHGAMSEVEAGKLQIDQCGACGGTWYDRDELSHAITAEKAKPRDLWDHLPASPPPAQDPRAKYRSCPVCRQSMLRKRKGPVIIDLCGPHGAFLEAGELEAIAQHVEAPAVEKKAKVPRPVTTTAFEENSVTAAIVGEVAIEVIVAALFDW